LATYYDMLTAGGATPVDGFRTASATRPVLVFNGSAASGGTNGKLTLYYLGNSAPGSVETVYVSYQVEDLNYRGGWVEAGLVSTPQSNSVPGACFWNGDIVVAARDTLGNPTMP